MLVAGGAGAFLWSEQQHDAPRGVSAGATTLTPSATVEPPAPSTKTAPTNSVAHQPEKISLDEVLAEQTPAAPARSGPDGAASHARTGSRKAGSSKKPRKPNLPNNPYEF